MLTTRTSFCTRPIASPCERSYRSQSRCNFEGSEECGGELAGHLTNTSQPQAGVRNSKPKNASLQLVVEDAKRWAAIGTILERLCFKRPLHFV